MATKTTPSVQTTTRPDALRFVGELDPLNRPALSLDGIPARDLTAHDLARLSDDQINRALNSGLYEAGAPPEETE